MLLEQLHILELDLITIEQEFKNRKDFWLDQHIRAIP